MTDEYKKQLLDYITGKINKTIGKNEPQLNNEEAIINNYNTFIINNIENISVNSDGIAAFTVVGNLQNDGRYLLYGNYYINDDEDNRYGALLILNEDLQPIKILTEFFGGTKFRKFELLNVDEDNNLYGVDNVTNFTESNKYRFIMLNNVINSGLINDYRVVLRKSYYFPNQYNGLFFGYDNDKKSRILKKNMESSYLFIGRDDNNNYATTVLKLDINVGSSNEWTTYSSPIEIAGGYIATLLNWSSDDLYLKICGTKNVNPAGYVELILTNGVLSKTLEISIEGNVRAICIKNYDETYLAICNTERATNEDTYKDVIGKVNYSSKSINTIYFQVTPIVYLINEIDMVLKNGNVFVKIANWSDYSHMDVYLGLINEDKLYTKYVGNISTWGSSNSNFFVTNYFNLYKIMIQDKDSANYLSLIYNSNNYNGKPYIDNNSLIANSSILYSNNSPIFARNLYNKTINDNVTVSTVEIPNTYLNSIEIDNKQLISQTNLQLLEDNNYFTKNVYETVYLNFINSLLIQDRNDLSDINNNLNASIYLNQKLNMSDEYDNAKLYNKAILYFENGTVEEKEYEFVDRSEKSVFIRMMIYVSEKIKQIEFISNDKKTIYHTINANSLEKGKLYKISQKLEVV